MTHKQLEHYLQHGKKSTISESLKRLTSAGTNSLVLIRLLTIHMHTRQRFLFSKTISLKK